MEFSDESDTEATTQTSTRQKRSTQKAVQNTKRTQDPPAENVLPQRQTRGSKKSTAVPRASSSEDDESLMCRVASTRRGRGRRDPTRAEEDSVEEPDKMRTIAEEITDALDISVEQLRTSDTETNPASADNIGQYFVCGEGRGAEKSTQYSDGVESVCCNNCCLMIFDQRQFPFCRCGF